MQEFGLKTKIFFGTGSLEHLSKLNYKKAFIVTDPFMVKSGTVNSVIEQLEKGNINFSVFSDIVPDPPIEVVVKGIEAMGEFDPDVVIALGGGSAIDAAKAISSFKSKVSGGINKAEGKRAAFIAIPTTSGTGSEVTSFSVITDREKNVKYPLVSEDLIPDEAILDAQLVKTVPDFITADTGMDVLTHAIEAYVSNKATTFTDALAEKSIKLVFNSLIKAYKNGLDEGAREDMHNASCIAGIAFTNASLGLNHGMAHILGGRFHVSHGRSNAILLPYVIEYNSDIKGFSQKEYSRAAVKYSEIAKMLGLSCPNVRQGVKNLITAIKNMQRELRLPCYIKEAGVSEEEFKKELAAISEIALNDKCTDTNPRKACESDIQEVFLKAYYGK